MMIWVFLICAFTVFLAYANGANDNFKGVATLFGSATTDYRKALTLATVSTFAGSLASYFLATKLIQTFSGKGLVPDAVVQDPIFMTAVILGAGITVFLATRIGMPISTTHSLMGSLVGVGAVAVSGELRYAVLGSKFVMPLLFVPLLAVLLALVFYPLFRSFRRWLGISKSTCVCIGEKKVLVGAHLSAGTVLNHEELRSLDIFVDEKEACEAKVVDTYDGHLVGMEVQKLLDGLHFLSAGAVSFARGLNDTPKIVALCIAFGAVGLRWNVAMVACAMALGGLISARRVAETMSHRITLMNHGQGVTANLITSGLVILASLLGSPVSTTHVSCGSLFGIGLINRTAQWGMIRSIVSAWVLTVPLAAVISGTSYFVLRAT